jgi:hypothetical protein
VPFGQDNYIVLTRFHVLACYPVFKERATALRSSAFGLSALGRNISTCCRLANQTCRLRSGVCIRCSRRTCGRRGEDSTGIPFGCQPGPEQFFAVALASSAGLMGRESVGAVGLRFRRANLQLSAGRQRRGQQCRARRGCCQAPLHFGARLAVGRGGLCDPVEAAKDPLGPPLSRSGAGPVRSR